MQSRIRILSPFVVVPALIALGIGCGNTDPRAREGGGAQVGVQLSALESSEITGVTITVGPGSGSPTFTPIVIDGVPGADGSWTAYLSDIPAGTGRTFQVLACRGEGPCNAETPAEDRLYEGEAIADVVAGQTAQVYILLQQTQEPNEFNNYAPVIRSLSASASTVLPGQTVVLNADAYDPDGGDGADGGTEGEVAYWWTASCGQVINGASAEATWIAPSPSEDRDCTVRLNVRDTCVGLPDECRSTVTAQFQVRIRNETNGDGEVIVYPNTCPLVTCVAGNQYFTYGEDGLVNGYEADITVTSVDPDADELRYRWSTEGGCENALFWPITEGFFTAANPTEYITDDGSSASRTVRFISEGNEACTVKVDVRDYWANGAPPDAGFDGDARGCLNTGRVTFGAAADAVFGPSIIGFRGPNQANLVVAGAAYIFAIEVEDDNFGGGAYPLTIEWSSDGDMGTFSEFLPESLELTGPGLAQVKWTAPEVLADGMKLRAKVTNKHGLYSEKVFELTR